VYHQRGERKLRLPAVHLIVLPVALALLDHPDQTAIGSDAGTLEIDLVRGVERVLKGLGLLLTRWVWTSGTASSHSNPHKYG
jgi:hypothetical protein